MKAQRFMTNNRKAAGECKISPIYGGKIVLTFEPDMSGHSIELELPVSALIEDIASLGQYKDQNILAVIKDVLSKRGLI